jgi:ABC-type antimicrobial peptide transport system permease subunit
LVRTKVKLGEFIRLAERAMWSIDPEQSVFDFNTYDERILGSVWQLRVSRMLLILFSAVALVLAAIGIYGVTSYRVGQRRRELGIRLALGASPQSLRLLIVSDGVILGGIGLGLGGIGALLLGQLLQHSLRGIGGIDAISFLGALGILFGVTLMSYAVPAWRGSRIDPVISLREE